eukprot:jgi/Tetstr1/434904/TSEL_023901.t1
MVHVRLHVKRPKAKHALAMLLDPKKLVHGMMMPHPDVGIWGYVPGVVADPSRMCQPFAKLSRKKYEDDAPELAMKGKPPVYKDMSRYGRPIQKLFKEGKLGAYELQPDAGSIKIYGKSSWALDAIAITCEKVSPAWKLLKISEMDIDGPALPSSWNLLKAAVFEAETTWNAVKELMEAYRDCIIPHPNDKEAKPSRPKPKADRKPDAPKAKAKSKVAPEPPKAKAKSKVCPEPPKGGGQRKPPRGVRDYHKRLEKEAAANEAAAVRDGADGQMINDEIRSVSV